MMNRPMAFCAAAIVASSFAAPAHAGLANLVPGAGVEVNGITSGSHPELAGSGAEPDLVQSFQIFHMGGALLYEAKLLSRVTLSNVNDTLFFTLRIFEPVGGGLNGIIASVEYTDFAGWTTDVEWRTDSLGIVGPSRVERSAGDGDTLRYLFGNQIAPDQESRAFFAMTNATEAAVVGTATIILTTGESASLSVYAPIPSPGSAGLLACAGFAMILPRRRG